MARAPCPRFRPDLVTRRVVEGGDAGYAVQDPVSGFFYRLDPLTHDLCLFLDGKRSHEQVLEALSQLYPQYEFSRDYLNETLEYLKKQGFLEDPFRRNLLVQERAKAARKRLLSSESLKNILFVQVGTVDASRFFELLYPAARIMFSKWWVVGTTIASVLAIWILWIRRDEVVGNLLTIFSLEDATWVGLLVLYVTLFLIVVAHEFGHGLCCMHYGGKPSKIGFLFMYFMPGMYCDVSDVYFFEKRWHRAAVALAGGYVELQAFALGTFIWVATPPDLLLHDIAYRVMLFSGVTGLIFNYNPLIKLDGYYVLMHWLDTPDLRERSFAWLKANISSWFSRKPRDFEDSTRRERRIYTLYGIAAILYSAFFLWISLLLVRNIFIGAWREAGFVVFAIFFFFVTRKLLGNMGNGVKLLVIEHAGFIRKKWAYFLAGTALLVLISLIPIPNHLTIDAVLRANDLRPVRAGIGGQIEAVFVRDGDPVRRGTVLAIISDPEQRSDRAVNRAGQESAILESRIREVKDRQTSRYLRREAQARQWLSDWQRQHSWMVSPTDGNLIAWQTEQMVGREVSPGDSIFSVGRLDSLSVVLQVSERQLVDLTVGQAAELRLITDAGHARRFRIEIIHLTPSRRPVLGEGAAALAERDVPAVLFEARGTIANVDRSLRPGLTGKVRLRGPSLSLVQRSQRLYARLVRADFWL